ncbi:MAG: helix-turn-helix transcriptional regulator [Myxococcales bacterium]|nr:helix-turn-helix transcriptional regulator [Myxococcales bacterium]
MIVAVSVDQLKLVLGRRIERALAERGMTKADLARLLNVEPPTVTRWCDGTNMPNLFTLMAISIHLDLAYDDLVPDVDRPSLRAA